MKKILIITYYWPPSGGAGVQRWLKFAKYLPQYGWQPVVLTVDPRYASYPQRDESLVGETGEQCLVFTTKSFELYNVYKLMTGKKEVPFGGFANASKEGVFQRLSRFLRGNFLLPDPRRGWNKYAYRKAVELIRQFDIDTVVTTSPPHSTQLIGLKLKKNMGIKWIADLRDPWTDIYYYSQFNHTPLARRLDLRYERLVVEAADVIVTVSEDVKRIFATKSSQPLKDKIHVIPNGFDQDDFTLRPVQRESKKVITYTGTISEAYDIDRFLEALRSLDEQLKSLVLLRFVGHMPSSVIQKFKDSGLEVELTGYVDHSKSIEYLLRSELLLLIIPRVKNNQGILTGKFFEYLASRKPILAIGPVDGDLARIMKEIGCGTLFDYEDAAGMHRFMADCLSSPEPRITPKDKAEAYSRKQLTGRMVRLLNA